MYITIFIPSVAYHIIVLCIKVKISFLRRCSKLEVDGICDGEDILIPGIMEHIERTGIHSGDSIAVYPSWNLNDVLRQKIISQSKDLALKLGTKGLVNIQCQHFR